MPPDLNIQTTTNQYLAPYWVDQTLRDNLFFGEILGKTKKWDGSQMLFPKLYQIVLATLPETVDIISPYYLNGKILMGK